jgi:hypothetical protein
MLYQDGERKTHTIEIGGHVQMAKRGSPRYRIAHGWKNEFGSLNLEILKFLMNCREPGSSLYFIFISYILIFIYFFFSHFFFILTFFFFLSFFSFLFAPLEL